MGKYSVEAKNKWRVFEVAYIHFACIIFFLTKRVVFKLLSYMII